MSGVTEHGIRYPDGASKAKNLGRELETFAHDVDKHIDDRTSAAGLEDIVRDLADELVAEELADLNSVRAYPEGPVQQTTLTAIPMRWNYKTLDSRVPETVPEVIPGTWVDEGPRRGDVPVIQPNGYLSSEQIPPVFATTTYVGQRINEAIAALPPVPTAVAEVLDLPVFRARLAHAKLLGLPLSLVFVGSSTTQGIPVTAEQNYVTQVVKALQTLWSQIGGESDVQALASADFTLIEIPGIHGYNAGQGGTNSADYLTSDEVARIAALTPALVVHMVGSNDWRQGRTPAQYAADLASKIAAIDAAVAMPVQHLLIQPYQRLDVTASAYTWVQYGDAQRDLADARATVVYLDISGAYEPLGVPGADPMNLIGTDNIHQTVLGYAFMASAIISALMRALAH